MHKRKGVNQANLILPVVSIGDFFSNSNQIFRGVYEASSNWLGSRRSLDEFGGVELDGS
jgi:hypothetical protein